MSRRSFCSGSHSWEASPRAPGRQTCRDCPATFPCREACAHPDCEEATGKAPKCPVCHQPVPGFDNGFHVSQNGKLLRLHPGECAESLSRASTGEYSESVTTP